MKLRVDSTTKIILGRAPDGAPASGELHIEYSYLDISWIGVAHMEEKDLILSDEITTKTWVVVLAD